MALRRKKADPSVPKKPRKEYWFGKIKCDSSLEVYCHKQLVEAGLAYDFHPTAFMLLSSFISTAKSYEPDERIGDGLYLKTNKIQPLKYTIDFSDPLMRWAIETKGYKRSEFAIRWKIFKHYLAQHNIEPTLFLPKNQKQVDETIQIILEKKLSEHITAVYPKLF